MLEEMENMAAAGVNFQAVLQTTAGFKLHEIDPDGCKRSRGLAFEA